jgi:hypothetical protein
MTARRHHVLALLVAVALLVAAPAVALAGTVETWGDNTYGQLGDGTLRAASRPSA